MKTLYVSIVLFLVVISPVKAAGDQSGIVVWNNAFRQLMSALKIDTKQNKTSAEQFSTSIRKTDEAVVSSAVQFKKNIAIADAKSAFSYETGQGYKPCMVQEAQADVFDATKNRKNYVNSIKAFDNNWFYRGGGRYSDNVSSIIALRKEVYCSLAEANKFGCELKQRGMPAGNSNAAAWLISRDYGAEEAMTGFDFIDTIAPLPSVPDKEKADADAGVAMEKVNAIKSGVMTEAARTVYQNIILDGLSSTTGYGD